MIAGIELGGTKTVVAVGANDGTLLAQDRFPTTTPEETLATAGDWITQQGAVEALGIGAFGPISISPDSAKYGHVLRTPKESWSGYNLLGTLQARLPDIPCALETDVNAAMLAEVLVGAARGCQNAAYITIGTGIGGGILADGSILHGALHSEFGHLNVPIHPDDRFAGHCAHHHTCLEGLASGPAMAARWGRPAHEIPPDNPAWDLEAWYLAQGILSLLAITSPSRVIIGGGVSQADDFHQKVETQLRALARNYFSTLEDNAPYVVPPGLAQNAGIQGALFLAAHQVDPSSPALRALLG